MTNLSISLVRQLDKPHLDPSHKAELRCQLAQEMEKTGDYEAARRVMGELWQRVGERPKLDGLEPCAAAEVLLCAGILTGWIGSCDEIEGAQESAKNLISESIAIFRSLSYPKKVLEAQTELAYCYWREGAYDEARIVLKDVLERLTTDNELKGKAVLRSAIVEWSALRYSDCFSILTDAAPLFDKITNDAIKGGYHNALAGVLEDLGTFERREDYTDRAFVEYAAAGFHFEQAGHRRYLANVVNNLGYLYFKTGKFREAHQHLDRARRLMQSLKDRGTVAQVDETRARVLLAEGRASEAESVGRAAVRALEKGGRQSLLAEALTTHGIALARLDYGDQARSTLQRAIEVAHQSGASNVAGAAALTMLEELGECLTVDEMLTIYQRADHWLASSQHPQILQRLRQAASRVLSAAHANKRTKPDTDGFEDESGTLVEMLKRYEHKHIEKALQSVHGSITQAARLLGLSHQSLAYTLEHRHKDLLALRSPVKKRLRSIITKS